MVITRIEISNFGKLAHYAADFDPQLVVLPERTGADVLSAIDALLREQGCEHHMKNGTIRSGTKICADIQANGKSYRISINKTKNITQLLTQVMCDNKAVAPKGFYRSIRQLPEEERLNRFVPNPAFPFSECLKQYKDPESICGNYDFTRMTDGVGRTDSFRMCLKSFIQSYEPQHLCGTNDVYIELQNDGAFKAKRIGTSEKNVFLGFDERVFFEFQCFLNVNRFWSDFEKIRDFNHVKSPLVIKGLPKTNTPFVKALLQKVSLERQIFLRIP